MLLIGKSLKLINLQGNHIDIIEKGSFSAMKYIDCIETLNLSKNKIYGDKQVIFEIYQFSNLKVLDISEQLVKMISL
jgi:hypothetical protein